MEFGNTDLRKAIFGICYSLLGKFVHSPTMCQAGDSNMNKKTELLMSLQ